jgi:hypothetical protein
VEFSSSTTLTSFPAPGCWARAPSPARAAPSHPACLFIVYLQSREGFPSPNLQHSGHPTLYPTCVYCSYCLLLSFSFFPGWRSVCPGGYAALAQSCLWEYCGTAKLTWSASSQAILAQTVGGPGALLVSLFNVKWRFSALAGVWRGQSFASSRWFCLQGVSPASLQDFTIGGSLSASSL